jgi:hypothetical protein
MKTICKITFVLALLFSFAACKKNQIGGKASVKGVVAHHGKPIPNARVFIKYGTTEFPGEDYTNYDTYVDADADGNYKVQLYKGSYYLFAKGYDMAIPAPYLVIGGLSVSVRNKENLTKDIAVSED